MHDNPGDGSPSEEDPGWPAVPGAAWWDQGSPAIPWRAEEQGNNKDHLPSPEELRT